jgi:hypothetical protein
LRASSPFQASANNRIRPRKWRNHTELVIEHVDHSGLIPSSSFSLSLNRLLEPRLSFGLSAGALRCVVYRDCTARLLTAGRVAPVEQHSHRCPVATSTRLFVRSTCHTQVSHSWSTSPHIQRPDHHQGSLLPVGSTAPTQLV